jgi:hypothetical protein
LACLNYPQILRFPGIRQHQGEAAVGVPYGYMADPRITTARGNAYPIPLQMLGEMPEGVALSAFYDGSVIF